MGDNGQRAREWGEHLVIRYHESTNEAPEEERERESLMVIPFSRPSIYSTKNLSENFKPFFADELYLGCYETQNNESNLYRPRLSKFFSI